MKTLPPHTCVETQEGPSAETVRARVRKAISEHEDVMKSHRAISDEGGDCGCSYKDCYDCGMWHNCVHGTYGALVALLAPEASK